MKTCKDYWGVTCIDGNCPNALAEEYPDRGVETVRCSECWHNKGCEDCVNKDYKYCKGKKID